MRVLIACEFSGIVRDAFLARGHDAWSCDYLPSESQIPEGRHIQGNMLSIVKWDWELMIAHPSCTYLTNAGSKHLYVGGKKSGGIDPDRWNRMLDAANFFNQVLRVSIPRICVENPIMHCHARARLARIYSQIIQPWQFGHGETKATCLWLKNLPKLTPTNIVDGRTPRVHHASPGPDRWRERSRTMTGIAAAMADQWGILNGGNYSLDAPPFDSPEVEG